MVDSALIEEALERRKARRESFAGVSYVRLTDSLQGWPRGSVVLEDGTVVPGYPSIGRVLNLEQGLAQHFQAPFHAEEKVDGFNVRIVRHAGSHWAFSRGGFVCPFTTDRVPDLIDTSVFDAEPDLVLCGEVAGPGNPYLEGHPPEIQEDVVLQVFDLMRFGAADFLPVEGRRALLERHALPAVPWHGRFDVSQAADLRALVADLDRRGVEGLVLKEEGERRKRAKYVTPASVVQDLTAMGDALLDLPPEYFTNRLLRLVLILEESPELDRPELRRELGAALIDPLLDAAREHRTTHKVAHSFCSRFRSKENAERFVEHLRRIPQSEIHSTVRSLEQGEDGYWELRFDRVFPRISGLLGNFLSGGQVYD